MSKKAWFLRPIACLLFTLLPMVLCTALLALAAPGGRQGIPQLRLVASAYWQHTTQEDGAALQYTLEVANEGDGPWLEGCIAHEGLAGGEPQGIQIEGGEYRELSTGVRGLLLTGVRLLPGEVLRVSYGVRGTHGERGRVTAEGSTPAGEPSEAAVDLQTPAQPQTHNW